MRYRDDFHFASSICIGCTAVYLFITLLLVFFKDPVDLTTAILASRMSPINTRLSSQAGREQTELHCFVVAWVEQRGQELTEPLIQIDRLQEIG